MALLRHRLTRAYAALALGGLLFLLWPMVLLDPLGGALPFDAAIAARTRFCLRGAGPGYCVELAILTCTVLAMALALGWHSPRQMLLACLLLTPPLLFFAGRSPFWIIVCLLVLAPLLINTVLNIWFSAP